MPDAPSDAKIIIIHRIAMRLVERICSTADAAAIPYLPASHNNPVRREELTFYIRGIHWHALYLTVEILQSEGLFPIAAPLTKLTKMSAKVKAVT